MAGAAAPATLFTIRCKHDQADHSPGRHQTREVAEAALAHTVSNKVEAAYRRTNYLEKRKVLISDWTDFCMGKIPAEQRQMLIAAN